MISGEEGEEGGREGRREGRRERGGQRNRHILHSVRNTYMHIITCMYIIYTCTSHKNDFPYILLPMKSINY